jgi:hypothetical protein
MSLRRYAVSEQPLSKHVGWIAAAQDFVGKEVLGIEGVDSQLLTLEVDKTVFELLIKLPEKRLQRVTKELLMTARLESREFRLFNK